MAAKWSPARGGLRSEAFPSSQECCPERPGAVKGAPLLGAAKRTLDGEDRSEMITEEGKAGRKIGERWSAILVSSPAASNTSGQDRSKDSVLLRPPPGGQGPVFRVLVWSAEPPSHERDPDRAD